MDPNPEKPSRRMGHFAGMIDTKAPMNLIAEDPTDRSHKDTIVGMGHFAGSIDTKAPMNLIAEDPTDRSHKDTIVGKLNEAARQIISKSSFTICRVPQELRKLKKSAYTPRLISIGPLHSEDEHLKTLGQNIKRSYVCNLFSNKSGGSEGVARGTPEECLKDMESLIDKAKEYYAEEVPALDAEMLVIDGCFILELLYRDHIFKKSQKEKPHAESNENSNQEPEEKSVKDPIFGKPHAESNENSNQKPEEKSVKDPIFGIPQRFVAVQHDLLLLENQIPFFVLEKLFSRTRGRASDLPELLDLVLPYFGEMLRIGRNGSDSSERKEYPPGDSGGNSSARNEYWPGDSVLSFDQGSQKSESYHHILHLLHKHYVPSNSTKEAGRVPFMPSASDLDYAGVKFVARTGEQDLFNVEFNPSTPRPLCSCCRRTRFEIPSLSVDDTTEPFLRNLVAFEQCCPGVSSYSLYFTSYAVLMDFLINSEKDVEVLEKAGVILNYLGTRGNLANLFNNLCQEVNLNTEKDFFFAKACQDAFDYSQNGWCSRAIPATTAYVIRKYSASPWTFKAFVIAFITFLISITNFVRSFHG